MQGVPAVGLYFTFAILQHVGACSPHLDDLIGSFPPGGEFPVVFSARRRTQSPCWKVMVLTFLLYVLALVGGPVS